VRAPLIVAGVVLIAGFLWAWELGFETTCGLSGAEGSSSRVEPAWWPPGTSRCVVENPDGTVTADAMVPWFEWAVVLLLAAVAAAATAVSAWALRTLTAPRRESA
jgi:hypothetical protein